MYNPSNNVTKEVLIAHAIFSCQKQSMRLSASILFLTSEALSEVSSIPLTSVTSFDAVAVAEVVVVVAVAELLQFDICIIEES